MVSEQSIKMQSKNDGSMEDFDINKSTPQQVVVITGANGCVGRAVLKLLITRDTDNIGEIRCLDLDECTIDDVSHENYNIKIKWIKGDVRDINIVDQTVAGATAVIHCASVIDVTGTCGDPDLIDSINVDGTLILLQSCVRNAVSSFVYVSSLEACAGNDAIYYATEATTIMPTNHLFGISGSSKAKAEQLVQRFARTKLDNCRDKSLNAVIVRLPPVYGPHDKHFVTQVLALTERVFNGQLRQLDHVWIRQQPIYVENAAWGIIRAKQQSLKDSSISGEEFYLTDDTAICDPFEFLEPYLECRHFSLAKPARYYIGVWLVLVIYRFMVGLLRKVDFFELMLTPPTKRHQKSSTGAQLWSGKRWIDYVTPAMVTFICNTYFFNRTKASLRLNYEPIFDPDESRERSLEWYKNRLNLSNVKLTYI